MIFKLMLLDVCDNWLLQYVSVVLPRDGWTLLGPVGERLYSSVSQVPCPALILVHIWRMYLLRFYQQDFQMHKSRH